MFPDIRSALQNGYLRRTEGGSAETAESPLTSPDHGSDPVRVEQLDVSRKRLHADRRTIDGVGLLCCYRDQQINYVTLSPIHDRIHIAAKKLHPIYSNTLKWFPDCQKTIRV